MASARLQAYESCRTGLFPYFPSERVLEFLDPSHLH